MQQLWKIESYGNANYSILSKINQKPLKGVSLTSTETTNFYMFYNNNFTKSEVLGTLNNISLTLKTQWGCNIIRIPLCMNAYALNPDPVLPGKLKDGTQFSYQEIIASMVSIFTNNGQVVILDGHVWGEVISSQWDSACPSSNAYPPVDIDSVLKDNGAIKKKLIEAWELISEHYKDNINVFFEVFNEPRFSNSSDPPDKWDWGQWQSLMLDLTSAVRKNAKDQLIIIGGLDFGYSFVPTEGNTSFKEQFNSNFDNLYNPFLTHQPIAFNMHPYQHAACCGEVTDENTAKDLSLTDPYFNTFCTYYPDGLSINYDDHAKMKSSGTYLYPKLANDKLQTCNSIGFSQTIANKMPPCKWKDITIEGKQGFCTGDYDICMNLTNETSCNSNTVAAGWDKNFSIMKKYGPIIMTEFGTYDCSTPYIQSLLEYAEEKGIAWTAWAIWRQNNGGPGGMGSCGYPSIVMNDSSGGGELIACKSDTSVCVSHTECQSKCNKLNDSSCDLILQPLGFYGKMIQSFMLNNNNKYIPPIKTDIKEHYEEDSKKTNNKSLFWLCISILFILLLGIILVIIFL